MASKHKANGNKLRRRTAKDFVGDEREITRYFDFVAGDEEIGSGLPVPNFSFNVASVVVFFVSIICYWNSCKGGFVFDDSEAIVGNKDLRAEVPLGELFFHDFWGGNMSSNTSHKSYRPLTILTFRVNYWLAGGLEPWGFHVVNVLLHAVVSVLSLKLFSVLVSGKDRNTSNLYDNSGKGLGIQFAAPKASLLCALLFAVHPIHTESVRIYKIVFLLFFNHSTSLTSFSVVLLTLLLTAIYFSCFDIYFSRLQQVALVKSVSSTKCLF